MKIVVVGLGYVGLSNAVLLAQHNEVIGVDVSRDRVDAVNARRSPIIDAELSAYLMEKELNLSASSDLKSSVDGADYVIISTPTNFDEQSNFFDTSSVETVIKQITDVEPLACIIVKSTVPIGFIDRVKNLLKIDSLIFSPEFLREGRALYDNLYPSRIIIGEKSKRAKGFANLLKQGALKKDIEILFTGSREAEALKLFANTYLAMRVAFFNELDSYALQHNMNTREIIEGISLDPRIGNYYNNPSFGYGGYCLPKDTKQLLANYDGVSQDLIGAIVAANKTRKTAIVNEILKRQPSIVGVYRLTMKAGSDNFRESAIQDVLEMLSKSGIEILIYEPEIKDKVFGAFNIENDFEKFAKLSDVIIANRRQSELDDMQDKIFTRDVFGVD